MAQQKPDRQPIDEILKLVDQLSAEQQDELDEQMKLRWLRRAVDQADESMAQGKVVSQEELDRRLDVVHAEILERQKK
jgi:hypothetical protein